LICMITVFGVVQFLVLTFIAGIFYPGGYDYLSYYFSDLGATVAKNGEANPISSKMFTTTLMVTAVTLVPFWVAIRSLFTTSRIEGWLSAIGTILGALSSPFIIGVAVFPMDTMLESHFIATLVFFSLFTGASLLYSAAIILNKGYPNRYGIVGLILFGASLLVYMNPLATYVAFLQNVLAYGYFIWILLPINLLWKYYIT